MSGESRRVERARDASGAEFGVFDGIEPALAASTGPLVVAPALGDERAGRLAVHWLVGGVAVSGLDPASLAVACTLPPGTTDDQFGSIWRGVDAAAAALGVAVVTGHTARYDGCAFPTVGAGTATAVGDPAALVTPGGARPGDRVVVTTGPATGAILFDGDGTVAQASAVPAARAAADTGAVTAMATGTVRGFDGALARIAAASGAGIAVERDRVPVQSWAREACATAGIDPWTTASPGTLVATVDPDGVERVVESLAAAGATAAPVGRVVAEPRLVVDGEPVDRPEADPLWPALADR